MATNYVKTMKDLEAATYGGRGGMGGNSLLKSAGIVAGLHTGHGGTETPQGTVASFGNLYNVVYGKKVWSMLNQEVNALAMLSKRPYTSSGWRIMTARPEGGSGTTFNVINSGAGTADAEKQGGATPRIDKIGGVTENARLITDIPAIAPTYTTLFTSPKTVAHMFEFTELALEMAKIDDGVGDLRALIREDMGKHHAEAQNKMLLMPLENYDQTDGSAVIDVTANYTSLFKIVASSQEIEAMEDASMIDTGASTTDGIINQMVTLFGNTDRQLVSNAYNESFMDAEVDYGDSYGSSDARPLTLTILNSMLRRIRENGGSPKVILTGYDTIQHLGDLLQSQERFMDRKEIIPTHGGVRGVKGSEVGFRVATYYDIPLIPCKDMPKTGQGSNKLSDMLILDTDHLWLSVMKPTEYFEDGIDNGNPFGVGTLGNQAMYRTIAETGCSFFKGQGKITNITSA